jgi:catechol-2,3-dioxygenase
MNSRAGTGNDARVEAGSVERTRGLTRGFCELTLEARDPAALAAFYSDIFGWEELSRGPDRIWLGCGERSRLGLWSRGEKEFGDEGGRHVHFALSVRRGQLDQLVRELSRLGVDHKGPLAHDGGDRSVYFEDPEGNVVEAWDFFEDGDGADEGVEALREDAKASADGAK